MAKAIINLSISNRVLFHLLDTPFAGKTLVYYLRYYPFLCKDLLKLTREVYASSIKPKGIDMSI